MDQTGKDDLKTQFATREGTYRLMTLSEYSRPNRVGYQTNQSNPQVRVSLVTLPPPGTASTPFVLPRNSSTTSSNASSVSTFTGPARSGGGGGGAGEGLVISPSLINSMTANGGVGIEELQQHQQINILASTSATNHLLPVGSSSPSAAGGIDRICFNFGKELYVYAYRGCKKVGLCLNPFLGNIILVLISFSSPPTLANRSTKNYTKEQIRVAMTSTRQWQWLMELLFWSALPPARSNWFSRANGKPDVFLTKR